MNVFFRLMGSARVKAAYKTFMKLTPGIVYEKRGTLKATFVSYWPFPPLPSVRPVASAIGNKKKSSFLCAPFGYLYISWLPVYFFLFM